MKPVNKFLIALLLGASLLSACSKQEEAPAKAPVAAAPAPATTPTAPEPVKEEPGGWVPPPAEAAPAAPAAEAAAPAAPPAK